MTLEQFALFAAWVSVALTLVAVLTWALPLVARILFLTKVDELRDRVVDMTLSDQLPADDRAVREFIEIQEFFQQHSRRITLARAVAYDMRCASMGLKPGKRAPYNMLEKDQRKFLHEVEAESKHALATYLVWGSPLGYLGMAVYKCIRPMIQRRHAQTRDELAAETYDVTRERVEAQIEARAAALARRGPRWTGPMATAR